MKRAKVKKRNRFWLGRYWDVFFMRIGFLVKQPVFILLTIVVHSTVFFAGFCLYSLEKEVNSSIKTLLDAIYWAMATVTSVGYGDVIPYTQHGKILAIILMVLGSLFTVLYTALFATVLLAPELAQVERNIRKIEHDIAIEAEELSDLHAISQIADRLKIMVDQAKDK